MSFVASLNANGVTAEDLEKAASVRLFEKAAASESVYSTELRNDVEAPINLTNLNTNMENPMDYIDLFEKQAADEGIDLDMLDDYELAELYNHFVDEVADEDDYFYDDEDDYFYDEEEAAYEKLAEAEILGEVMADAYLDKLAEAEAKKSMFQRGKARVRAAGRGAHQAAGELGQVFGGKAGAKGLKGAHLRGYGALGAGALAAGGAGYALAKRRSEKRASEKAAKPGFFKRTYEAGKGKAKAVDRAVQTFGRMGGSSTSKALNRARGYGALAAGAGAAGYAGKKIHDRMNKKASLIEELALEKAASYIDGDYEFDMINEVSDELALEILAEQGLI